ncbi:hypothetical protein Ancab_036758 [Ancistrocladus abbreviatus]
MAERSHLIEKQCSYFHAANHVHDSQATGSDPITPNLCGYKLRNRKNKSYFAKQIHYNSKLLLLRHVQHPHVRDVFHASSQPNLTVDDNNQRCLNCLNTVKAHS